MIVPQTKPSTQSPRLPGRAPIPVAIVVHTFALGGAERIAAMLANHVDRGRFRPMIVCLNRSQGAAGWGIRDDVPIVELRKRSGNDFRLPFRLAKVFRDHQVRVVHSNNWGTLLETTLARRWARVPKHVHVEHGAELADLQIGFWKRKLRGTSMGWALHRVDTVVSVCPQVTERLVRRCEYPADRVRLVPNGVEIPSTSCDGVERSRIRKSLGITPDALLVGSVGRLAPVKDFATAIDAVARLIGQGADVHLLLVGDGPLREPLETKAKTLGMSSRVHFAGRQLDVGPWLAAMDVYVNSSVSEGMSLSILEAMSVGLPLVVTDAGENAALLDEQPACGLVVPAQAPDAIALALARLLGDSEARHRLGSQARKRFRRLYTIEHMVSRYEALYATVCSGSLGGAAMHSLVS